MNIFDDTVDMAWYTGTLYDERACVIREIVC